MNYNYKHWKKNKGLRKQFFDKMMAKFQEDDFTALKRSIWYSRDVVNHLPTQQGKHFEMVLNDALAHEPDTVLVENLDGDGLSSKYNPWAKADNLYHGEFTMPYNVKTTMRSTSINSRTIKLFDLSFNKASNWKEYVDYFLREVGDDNLFCIFTDLRSGETMLAFTSLTEIQEVHRQPLADVLKERAGGHVICSCSTISEAAKGNDCFHLIEGWDNDERDEYVAKQMEQRKKVNNYTRFLG